MGTHLTIASKPLPPVRPSIRRQMIDEALELALHNEDQGMIRLARRCLKANRLGWKKYAQKGDWYRLQSYLAGQHLHFGLGRLQPHEI